MKEEKAEVKEKFLSQFKESFLWSYGMQDEYSSFKDFYEAYKKQQYAGSDKEALCAVCLKKKKERMIVVTIVSSEKDIWTPEESRKYARRYGSKDESTKIFTTLGATNSFHESCLDKIVLGDKK